MMTALSSEDQRQRGENLGADKYLVKSQVGIEDVINAVHEVLGDKPVAAASSDTSASVATPANSTTPASVEASPAEPAAENASVLWYILITQFMRTISTIFQEDYLSIKPERK